MRVRVYIGVCFCVRACVSIWVYLLCPCLVLVCVGVHGGSLHVEGGPGGLYDHVVQVVLRRGHGRGLGAVAVVLLPGPAQRRRVTGYTQRERSALIG